MVYQHTSQWFCSPSGSLNQTLSISHKKKNGFNKHFATYHHGRQENARKIKVDFFFHALHCIPVHSFLCADVLNINTSAYDNCIKLVCLTSSSKIMAGALSSVRAMATLCFSPPLSFRPLSPTTVSYSGKHKHANTHIHTHTYIHKCTHAHKQNKFYISRLHLQHNSIFSLLG